MGSSTPDATHQNATDISSLVGDRSTAAHAAQASENLSRQANEIGMTGFTGGVHRVALVVGNGLLAAPEGAVETAKEEGVKGVLANVVGSAAVGFGMRMLMAKAAPVAEIAAIGLGTVFVAKSAPMFYDSIASGLHAKTWTEMNHASRQFGHATGAVAFDSVVGAGGFVAGAGAASKLRFGKYDALALKPLKTETHDVDGRTFAETAARREAIEAKFKPVAAADKPALRAQVSKELGEVKAIGIDGKPTNAFDSLMSDAKMSKAQKESVIDNLGIVREHLTSYRLGDRMHPDPEVNWIHTQGELAKVLEAGRAKNLSANDMQDSLISSMYSDAVKFSAPAPEGTTPNFHTHHLDGALAAEYSLKQQNYPADRLNRVVESILAHQIAPPEFMGQLYHMKINGVLEGMIKDGKVSAEKGQAMRETLGQMTEVGADGVKRIRQLAQVESAPRVTNAQGLQMVKFSPEEAEVFGLSGTDRWVLPYDPAFDPAFQGMSARAQAAQLSRRNVARNLIDGDGVDNYATTGGASKIVAIRGPETWFQDKTVWDSINSIDKSYKDAYRVLTPEGQAMADRSLTGRNLVTDRSTGTLKTYMDTWLKDTKGLDPAKDNIPFYNSDLLYAKAGETPTAQQAADAKLATDIRSQVVDFLRRDHRTDNSLPGLFQPVPRTSK